MAIQQFAGYKIYIDGYDRSGDFNKINLDYSADELDSTSLADTSKEFIAGLKNVKFDGDIFTSHGVGEAETTSSANFTVSDKVISVFPGNTAGSVGYAFRSVQLSQSPTMTIGDIARFTISASSSGSALIRVTDMEALATKTSTGTGTARQLGAVSAAQTLYSFLHVISASTGDTLDITIESDNAEGFSSATTQITHTQFNAIGAEYKTKAGAITDDWFRVKWTIAGTDPSFTFNVGLGIL